MKKVLLILLFCIFHSWNGKAQADFYSLQPLGDRYIYDSEYFDDSRELQVYRSGVDATLKSDSLLTIYVFDAQYPCLYSNSSSGLKKRFTSSAAVLGESDVWIMFS